MRTPSLGLLTALTVMLAACSGLGPSDSGQLDTSSAAAAESFATAHRPGIRFDPAGIRPGSRVGALVVEAVTVNRAGDGTAVGSAHFTGEIELSGWTMRNPDVDSRAICFEADSASAARLPRWEGDERRPWFCFGNHAQAERELGPPSEGLRATVLIDRFIIWRGMSDEVNEARLVDVRQSGPGATGAGANARPGPPTR